MAPRTHTWPAECELQGDACKHNAKTSSEIAVSYTPPHVARDSLGTPWGLLGDSLETPWGLLVFYGLLGDSFGTPLGLLGSPWGLHQESIKSLHGVYGDY